MHAILHARVPARVSRFPHAREFILMYLPSTRLYIHWSSLLSPCSCFPLDFVLSTWDMSPFAHIERNTESYTVYLYLRIHPMYFVPVYPYP